MLKKILLGCFILHFGAATWSIFSRNYALPELPLVNGYIGRFFPQAWEMFAPPPQKDTRLFLRFVTHTGDEADTSAFQDVLGPLYQHQKSDFYALGRLSYFLYNCTQMIQEDHAYFLEHLPDHIDPNKHDSVDAYINAQTARTYPFYGLRKYAQGVYQAKFAGMPADSVTFSFHILSESILPYTQRKRTVDFQNMERSVWNSTFYRLFDR